MGNYRANFCDLEWIDLIEPGNLLRATIFNKASFPGILAYNKPFSPHSRHRQILIGRCISTPKLIFKIPFKNTVPSLKFVMLEEM
jgi:hypothetical protein